MLTPQTTQDLIASALRADITSGRVPPGAALRQEDLAQRFAVSRIPVREALRRLESEGLVRVYANRGAFVVSLSAGEIQEIMDLRGLLEGDLMFRAVPRLAEPDWIRIRAAAAAAKKAAATPEWVATDRRFHEALYIPAARPRQLALVMSLRTAIERYETIYRRLPKKRGRWLRDHDDILKACELGDAEGARALLSDHIARAGEFLIECLADEVA
jgi:DNA-binding GntR family transcriptional regulator